MAFGLRPYITEDEGTIRLRTSHHAANKDRLARRGGGASTAPSPTRVEMDLPFASPPHAVVWTDRDTLGGLLRRPEQALSFPLKSLPSTVNQDVRITITLANGRNVTKWRRLGVGRCGK